jgi:hypothetical protein
VSAELQLAADAALSVISRGLGDPAGPGLAFDQAHAAAVRDVADLIAAFIDADVHHSDAEVAGYLAVVGPLVGGALGEAGAEDLRRSGQLVGARVRLTRVSDAFRLLVAADARDQGTRGWAYLRVTVGLAHAVAALDLVTSEVELDALARYRHLLLSTLHDAGVQTPDQRRPDGGFFSPPGAPPAAAPAAPVVAAALVDRGRALPAPATPAPAITASPAAPVRADGPAARSLEEVLAELDGLTGLEPVKAEVALVTDLLTVQRLRAGRGLPTLPVSRHLVFTGNPGTGKTTVARLVAEIYASLGLLSCGHLVETDRAGLVAGYVGQTAERTSEVVASALDGVLLIDEAYALNRADDGRDFGREAIDTLVKLMEDHRNRLVVIVTGYPEEMTGFVGSNPGLASRFPRTLHFPDYTTDELATIATELADRHGYRLSSDAVAALRDAVDAVPRGRGFGNARLARNLVEAAVARHASRLAQLGDALESVGDEELSNISAADVLAAVPDVAT